MGMKIEKAGGIEIYSAQNYLKTRNNWGIGGLLLHEYSHAYHYKHCSNGYENEDILEVNLTYNFSFLLIFIFFNAFSMPVMCFIFLINVDILYLLYTSLQLIHFYIYFQSYFLSLPID